jgi:hypothetical protein
MADILVGEFIADKNLNQIGIANHGLLNGDTVRFTLGAVNNNLPAPLVVGTWYYVVSAATDTFQVASTKGGVFIDLTSTGTGHNNAWSPAPTADVWCYEMVVAPVNAPEYVPDVSEVNYYAERGWELKFTGWAAGKVTGRFWFLMQKQEPPSG